VSDSDDKKEPNGSADRPCHDAVLIPRVTHSDAHGIHASNVLEEPQVVQQIRALRAAGAHLDTPNVWMVITRYQDAGISVFSVSFLCFDTVIPLLIF
jgi:hypothetical protein